MPKWQAMEGSMKVVQKIRSLLHQQTPVASAGDNQFKTLDRATLSVMRERAEKIEEARRYWICPFCGYGRDVRGS